MQYPKKLFDTYSQVVICGVVIEELDKLKNSSDSNKQYQARLAMRILQDNEDKIEYVLKDSNYQLPHYFSRDSNDNRILSILGGLLYEDSNIVTLSNDLNFKLKCKCLNFKVISFGEFDDADANIYKGYKYLSGDTDFINNLLNDINNGINTYEFVVNEFLILNNLDSKKSIEYRFDGDKFLQLKLPDSKIIKGLNSLQRCALDLLNNNKIPIVAINGEVGSGKTYSCTRLAVNFTVDKGLYDKVLVVREAIGEGKEVGFLKGTFEDKTKLFFRPIEQSLKGGEFELQSLIQHGTLESTIPFYLKGTTFPGTIIICDESEDLSKKQLKLVGTRLGKDSRIFFAGDYKQSSIDYSYGNPLVQMCNELKGKKEFGCVYLDEDVRSDASKIFANLFTGK